jgi:hypothetical protein
MPTYRSDVVGSLLRPAYLKEARERYASGGLSDVEFKRLEDRAVNDAVAWCSNALSWSLAYGGGATCADEGEQTVNGW